MSQQKVSDYFSTKKRARQEDLSTIKEKDKRLKSCEPAGVTTRQRKKEALSEQIDDLSNTNKKEMIKDMQKKLALAKEQLEANKERLASSKKSKETQEAPASKKTPSNVNELRERIKNFNQNLAKHTEKYATKQKDNVSSKELLDAKPQEDPAFVKYANLASNDIEKKLVLPSKYSILSDMFKGTDTTIKFLNNRQEICTFLKLKTAVQNMTKKNFTLIHLGQIKTIYPEAYLYSQEKMYIDQKNGYHLTIAANLSDPSIKTNENGIKVITPHLLLERLDRFKLQLINMVKVLHEKFLKSIGFQIDTNEIKRWHPKFDLDSVPDIEASELPQPPNEIKCKTAEDLISIAKEVYSVRVQSAINELLVQQQSTSTQTQTQTKQILIETTTNQTSLQAKQKASYNALLEKVRAREKQKALENMVTNSEKEKRLVLVDKYTESARFLKSYFSAEKKGILELDNVCIKMYESLRSWTPHECEQIIREIGNDFSEWLSIVKVRQSQYVKLEKSIDINDIYAKIDNMIKTLKC